MTLFEKWWDRNTKTFSIQWCPRHTLRCFFRFHNNGAKKGIDRCYDGSFWILGFCFNYDIYDGTSFRVTDTIAREYCKMLRSKEGKDVQEDRD